MMIEQLSVAGMGVATVRYRWGQWRQEILEASAQSSSGGDTGEAQLQAPG